MWQKMVAEEKQVQAVSTEKQTNFPQSGSVIPSDADGTRYDDLPDEDDEERSQQDIDEAVREAQSLEFDPLDPLTLGSFPIVAGRINKLLNNCANNTHVVTNALLAIVGPFLPLKRDFNPEFCVITGMSKSYSG